MPCGDPKVASRLRSTGASTAGDSWDFVTAISKTTRSPQSIVGTRATVPSFLVQTVVRPVAQRRFESGTAT